MTGKPGRSAAFALLFDYIAGANSASTGSARMAMTVPVAVNDNSAPAQGREPEGQGVQMRFFLPARYLAERAPVPHDPRISVKALPDETYAVLRYAGSAQSFRQREAELLVRLNGTGWQAVGRPFTQFYDAPFTVPALRRNEAAVCVAKAALPAPA
jgi:hypothetical protein